MSIFKLGHSRPSILYFRLFYAVYLIQLIADTKLTGFEPRTSGVGSNHSTNHCRLCMITYLRDL